MIKGLRWLYSRLVVLGWHGLSTRYGVSLASFGEAFSLRTSKMKYTHLKTTFLPLRVQVSCMLLLL